MKLSTLLHAHHIIHRLASRTVEEAVRELLAHAEGFNPWVSHALIMDAVSRREAQASTSLAHGVAMPHARIPGLRDFVIMLGMASPPLENRGLDGAPIDLVFLILADDRKNTLMLQSLAAISRFAGSEGGLDALRAAGSREAMWHALDEGGVTVKRTLHASDLMKDRCVRAIPEMYLRDLLDVMFMSGLGEVVVLDAREKVIGCVSSKEIIEAGFPDYMTRFRDVAFLDEYEPFEQFFKREGDITTGDIMNRNPLVVDIEDPMIQVVFRMRRMQERFAFVEREGRFVGLVDRNDIIHRILRA